MRLLVCGGRAYLGHEPTKKKWASIDDRDWFWSVMDKWHKRRPVSLLIHGACGLDLARDDHYAPCNGADGLAASWAQSWAVDTQPFPAPWSTMGRPAGQWRNGGMLDAGRPDCVLAWPGGLGTANMVMRSLAAGVPVWRVDVDEPGGAGRIIRVG